MKLHKRHSGLGVSQCRESVRHRRSTGRFNQHSQRASPGFHFSPQLRISSPSHLLIGALLLSTISVAGTVEPEGSTAPPPTNSGSTPAASSSSVPATAPTTAATAAASSLNVSATAALSPTPANSIAVQTGIHVRSCSRAAQVLRANVSDTVDLSARFRNSSCLSQARTRYFPSSIDPSSQQQPGVQGGLWHTPDNVTQVHAAQVRLNQTGFEGLLGAAATPGGCVTALYADVAAASNNASTSAQPGGHQGAVLSRPQAVEAGVLCTESPRSNPVKSSQPGGEANGYTSQKICVDRGSVQKDQGQLNSTDLAKKMQSMCIQTVGLTTGGGLNETFPGVEVEGCFGFSGANFTNPCPASGAIPTPLANSTSVSLAREIRHLCPNVTLSEFQTMRYYSSEVSASSGSASQSTANATQSSTALEQMMASLLAQAPGVNRIILTEDNSASTAVPSTVLLSQMARLLSKKNITLFTVGSTRPSWLRSVPGVMHVSSVAEVLVNTPRHSPWANTDLSEESACAEASARPSSTTATTTETTTKGSTAQATRDGEATTTHSGRSATVGATKTPSNKDGSGSTGTTTAPPKIGGHFHLGLLGLGVLFTLLGALMHARGRKSSNGEGLGDKELDVEMQVMLPADVSAEDASTELPTAVSVPSIQAPVEEQVVPIAPEEGGPYGGLDLLLAEHPLHVRAAAALGPYPTSVMREFDLRVKRLTGRWGPLSSVSEEPENMEMQALLGSSNDKDGALGHEMT